MAPARKQLADGARHILKGIGIRTITTTMHGAAVEVPLAFGRLTSLLFDPDYMRSYGEEELIDFMLARITREDVVFDVGAYIGLHAVLFSRAAGLVLAFEPNPHTFAVLQDTITSNQTSNVIAYPLAIGRQTELATLWDTGSASSLRPDANPRQTVQVNPQTLDSFVDARDVLPDVMKIDVEGAEYDVLVGAARCLKNCRLLCIEIHLDQLPRFGATPEMVFALLAEHGFKEISCRTPERLGEADPSRRHLIVEKERPAKAIDDQTGRR